VASKPNILLTGGRGFFGRRIGEALSARGFPVVAPSRAELDLLDRASCVRALARIRPDMIVHSAAYYGGLGICVAEPVRIFRDNVLMFVHLIDAAAEAKVGRFMSIGSACAYPGDVAGDMREDEFWAGALHPSVEPYGFVKKVHQVGIHAYGKQAGMGGQLPIITNLYGEHDVFGEYRSHVVAALIKKFADATRAHADEVVCWGTGAPVREFLYVGDAAEAVARLAETDHAEPINIGTGVGTTIRELAGEIARLCGFQGRIVWDASKPDGVMRKVLDVSRMKQVLGWQPPTSLSAGLERTIRWYLANQDEADARP
jgi:GDP-L-fucose synthase